MCQTNLSSPHRNTCYPGATTLPLRVTLPWPRQKPHYRRRREEPELLGDVEIDITQVSFGVEMSSTGCGRPESNLSLIPDPTIRTDRGIFNKSWVYTTVSLSWPKKDVVKYEVAGPDLSKSTKFESTCWRMEKLTIKKRIEGSDFRVLTSC